MKENNEGLNQKIKKKIKENDKKKAVKRIKIKIE